MDEFCLNFSNDERHIADSSEYRFISKLHQPLHLEPDTWEVGLVQIAIPIRKQFRLPTTKFFIGVQETGKNLVYKYLELNNIFYATVDDLIDYLSKIIPISLYESQIHEPKDVANLSDFLFQITMENNRVKIPKVELNGVNQSQIKSLIMFQDNLLKTALGLSQCEVGKAEFLPIHGNTWAPSGLEVSAIAVLAPNLIQPQLLGKKKKPVLDIIEYRKQGLHIAQDLPLYKPVVGGYINEIEIVLEDLFGNSLNFDSGKLHLQLKFRRCQTSTTQ